MNKASNREVTLLRKLNRKKHRQKEQLFVIEGGRSIQQLLDNQIIHVETLFFDEKQEYWLHREWTNVARKQDSRLLTPDVFHEVADTENPQGVLALCRMPPEVKKEQIMKGEGIIIATDAIQDPGNLGTIIRTAGWFGTTGMLLGKGTVDMFHPKVVRGTAGATGTVPYNNSDLENDLVEFEKFGWQVVLLDAGRETKNLREFEPTDQTILVIGNEANGIASSLFSKGREIVEIPSSAASQDVESLNAAIALSIGLYAISG